MADISHDNTVHLDVFSFVFHEVNVNFSTNDSKSRIRFQATSLSFKVFFPIAISILKVSRQGGAWEIAERRLVGGSYSQASKIRRRTIMSAIFDVLFYDKDAHAGEFSTLKQLFLELRNLCIPAVIFSSFRCLRSCRSERLFDVTS